MDKKTIQKLGLVAEQVRTLTTLINSKIKERSDAPKDCRDRKIKELEDRLAELEKSIANNNKK